MPKKPSIKSIQTAGSGAGVSETDTSSSEKNPVSFRNENCKVAELDGENPTTEYCVNALCGTPVSLIHGSPPNETPNELMYGTGVEGACASQKLIV